MPQRQGKGTNATLRNNELERKANRGDFLIDKNHSLPLSLSKSRRWELLDDNEKQFPIRKMIPSYLTCNYKNSPYLPKYFPGGIFCDYDQARRYQSVNGKRSTVDLEADETVDAWFDLSFKTHEYPLKRELHKKHDTPCKGCLCHGGVLLFRGRGKKSSRKTKGMKSYYRKEWNDEFNL